MFLRYLANNRRSASLANYFRRKRFARFLSHIKALPRPLTVLDVGGEENFWKQVGVTAGDGLHITLINLHAEPVSMPFLKSLAGDARSLSQFADKSFDIVFSNSVIEHVGDFADQRRMAQEIVRVGKNYYVQTPARSFPIEPHFMFPFFAVLPQAARLALVQHLNLGWYKKIPDKKEALEFLRGFQLLNAAQMRSLFPQARLNCERFLGLTKSYISSSFQFDA